MQGNGAGPKFSRLSRPRADAGIRQYGLHDAVTAPRLELERGRRRRRRPSARIRLRRCEAFHDRERASSQTFNVRLTDAKMAELAEHRKSLSEAGARTQRAIRQRSNRTLRCAG